jgi:hypothetical protein
VPPRTVERFAGKDFSEFLGEPQGRLVTQRDGPVNVCLGWRK